MFSCSYFHFLLFQRSLKIENEKKKNYTKTLTAEAPYIGLRVLRVHIDTYRKILKFGTPQTIAIIVLKIEKFDVTLH